MEKVNIKEYITTLVQKLGATVAEVDVFEDARGTVVNLTVTDNAHALIGPHKETLRALNHIVRRVTEGQSEDEVPIRVDINNHETNHLRFLENQAQQLAERVVTLKQEVEMTPMNPYDRMIVHETIRDIEGVSTQSVGEGRLRHVVIQPDTDQ